MRFLAHLASIVQLHFLLLLKDLVILATTAQMAQRPKLLNLNQPMVVNNAHLATTVLLVLLPQSCVLQARSTLYMEQTQLEIARLAQQDSTAKDQETLRPQQLAKPDGTAQQVQPLEETRLKFVLLATTAQLVLLQKHRVQLILTKKTSGKSFAILARQDSNALLLTKNLVVQTTIAPRVRTQSRNAPMELTQI